MHSLLLMATLIGCICRRQTGLIFMKSEAEASAGARVAARAAAARGAFAPKKFICLHLFASFTPNQLNKAHIRALAPKVKNERQGQRARGRERGEGGPRLRQQLETFIPCEMNHAIKL
jgi:hypothetical protein